MSDNEITPKYAFTEANPNFVFVIDGEVVDTVHYPSFPIDDPSRERIDRKIAIMKSSPQIIWTTEHVVIGSSWDGSTFTPPTE